MMADLLQFGVDVAVSATLVLALAWLAARICRGSSAATRHAVWVAGMIACLALPSLGALAPELRLVIPVAADAGSAPNLSSGAWPGR